MPAELRMLRMSFDAGRLYALARRRRLRDPELGYVLHCQLKELFGDDAPCPFLVGDDRGRRVTVLAYSARTRDELLEHAARFADPGICAACDLEALSEKRMPATWPTGLRCGFEVRAAPIVRLSNDLAHYRKGAEVDAFLVQCARAPGRPVDREAVYRAWLGAELERRGGARLLSAQVKAFQRDRLLRRTQGEDRRVRTLERPDVRFSGCLEVTDGAAFQALLGRGIGRHRAFGFGMLLLRPTASPC